MKVLGHVSGGFDSTAACIKLLEDGHEVRGLFFNLNQPYFEQENRAVRYVSDFFACRYPNWLGLTTEEAPMRLQLSSDGSPSEYIPVRNFVLGAHSANIALAEGFEAVAVGNKTTELRPDDLYSFRDCSIEFYEQMERIVGFCSEGDATVKFLMPLIHWEANGETTQPVAMTKTEVVNTILKSGMDITKLWSCYRNEETPCGECHNCLEVRKAFDDMGYDYRTSPFLICNVTCDQ